MNYEIPVSIPNPEQIATQQEINAEIIKQEITDHINNELRRFSREIGAIKNEGHLS